MFVLLIAAAVTFLDQFTKHIVRGHFRPGESLPVIPGLFDLTYVRNTGAAWGMLAGRGAWLIALSVAMLVVLVAFRRAFLTDGRLSRVAMGLMISGIVGNLIDRVGLGYVVDFLDFHWRGHHFPAFNVADSAICCGVGFYVLAQYLAGRAAERAAAGCVVSDAAPGGG